MNIEEVELKKKYLIFLQHELVQIAILKTLEKGESKTKTSFFPSRKLFSFTHTMSFEWIYGKGTLWSVSKGLGEKSAKMTAASLAFADNHYSYKQQQ